MGDFLENPWGIRKERLGCFDVAEGPPIARCGCRLVTLRFLVPGVPGAAGKITPRTDAVQLLRLQGQPEPFGEAGPGPNGQSAPDTLHGLTDIPPATDRRLRGHLCHIGEV